MRKRRANNFPPIGFRIFHPAKLRISIICWKTLILGQFMAISFTDIASANDEFAPIFSTEIDSTFLNRINSIHVEGLHSSFGKRIGRKRPNFCFLLSWKVLERLSNWRQISWGKINRGYRRKRLINLLAKLRENWQRDVIQRKNFYKSSPT